MPERSKFHIRLNRLIVACYYVGVSGVYCGVVNDVTQLRSPTLFIDAASKREKTCPFDGDYL
jgi:hypothetical protein